MRKLAFIFFVLVGITACQNDEVDTFGQQTANKLQAYAQQAGANSAQIYINNTVRNSGSFSFEGDFIIVDLTRYNLNQLIGYTIFNSAGVRTLVLYF